MLLLVLTPVWLHVAGSAIALVLLQLPLYMVHQFEEHHHDRFRLYLNQKVAHCDALTPEGHVLDQFARRVGARHRDAVPGGVCESGVALAAFYLPMVNALTHIREAVARREYNPGLCTSIVLFLPIARLGLVPRVGGVGGDLARPAAGARHRGGDPRGDHRVRRGAGAAAAVGGDAAALSD